MKVNSIQHSGFHGFTSNRFGWIAEISKEFNNSRAGIKKFFDECVNINSNNLVLAVSAYIESDWFLLCSRVYERIGNDLIFPLMEVLGIDKAKYSKRDDRTWEGLKEFFCLKIPELKKRRDQMCKEDNEEELLYIAVLDEVIITVERQLSDMSFFTDEDHEVATEKMKHAPITNLGCESEFAKLDTVTISR